MGLKEGEVIQAGLVTKSIERAQKKIEENNYGVRKRLLEYDDVMNSQREVIYKRRKNALLGERLDLDISNMIHDTLYLILENYQATGDLEELESDIIMTFSHENLLNKSNISALDNSLEQVVSDVGENIRQKYYDKLGRIKDDTFSVIKERFSILQQNNETVVIGIPFSDGMKEVVVRCDLDDVMRTNGQAILNCFTRDVILNCIDKSWKDHLKQMDDLKQSVQGAVYEQKDPLLKYKFESFNLRLGFTICLL